MTPGIKKRYVAPTNRERLCEMMKANNLNRAQVARICGWSKSAVDRWLSGSRNVSDKRLTEISVALATHANQNCKEDAMVLKPVPLAVKHRIDVDVQFHIRKTMAERLRGIGRGIYSGICGLVNHALIPVVLPLSTFALVAPRVDDAIKSVAPDAGMVRFVVVLAWAFAAGCMSVFLMEKAAE
ncbi:MAG TPA: hypothetical protein DCW68_06985 [Rhodospirillaceae bacterium]|nr:hypothetical protein [Rhodospirillaceae bacterium]